MLGQSPSVRRLRRYAAGHFVRQRTTLADRFQDRIVRCSIVLLLRGYIVRLFRLVVIALVRFFTFYAVNLFICYIVPLFRGVTFMPTACVFDGVGGVSEHLDCCRHELRCGAPRDIESFVAEHDCDPGVTVDELICRLS